MVALSQLPEEKTLQTRRFGTAMPAALRDKVTLLIATLSAKHNTDVSRSGLIVCALEELMEHQSPEQIAAILRRRGIRARRS